MRKLVKMNVNGGKNSCCTLKIIKKGEREHDKN